MPSHFVAHIIVFLDLPCDFVLANYNFSGKKEFHLEREEGDE